MKQIIITFNKMIVLNEIFKLKNQLLKTKNYEKIKCIN